MRDTAASRNNLLPYPVITAAVQGDPDAVNRVIGHYSGYIAALSTRTSYDPQGCPHSQVDDDLRRRLETKLIIAILDFDLTDSDDRRAFPFPHGVFRTLTKKARWEASAAV